MPSWPSEPPPDLGPLLEQIVEQLKKVNENLDSIANAIAMSK